MTATLDEQIVKMLPLLGLHEKKSLLAVISSFLELREQRTSANYTMEEYNRELNEAEAQYQRGEYVSDDDLMADVVNW